MSWNYRVMENSSGNFYISEVYYEDDEPQWYSDGMSPFGESLDDLKINFERMQEAFNKPTLKEW